MSNKAEEPNFIKFQKDEIKVDNLPEVLRNFILDKECDKDELKSVILDNIFEKENLKINLELVLGIIHDLNNILTPIAGSIQLLNASNIDNKNIKKYLNIIETCTYDSINIINKVVKITDDYKQSNNLNTFNINKCIQDAVDLVKNKLRAESASKGIKIDVVTSFKASLNIKANITEIREVYINLLNNAIDALPHGGIIEISTMDDDGYVVTQVKDNGIGIDSSNLNNIFEPFFTTKGSHGSGLGLSISYKNVKENDGKISVESTLNKGTIFTISFPASKDNINTSNEEPEKRNIDFKGSILLIDDHSKIRSVVADIIKLVADCKIKSIDSSNVEEEIKRRKYDIVISDFSMPNINGIEVAKLVKKYSPNTYFCLMTGWIGKFNKDSSEKIDFILSKPVNKKKIAEIFANYIKHPVPTD